MPTQRRAKQGHLIHADVVDSKCKTGIWFGERDAFQDRQRQIVEAIKDRLDWIPLKNAILAISVEPPGITVIAPNPTLPGMIVLSDGGSPAATAALQAAHDEVIRNVMAELGILEEEAG